MTLFRYAAAALCAVLLCAGGAVAQELSTGGADTGFVQELDKGSIDWNRGLITAKGIGVPPANVVSRAQARPMAIRAATSDARRNLLELIEGVQIDASTSVKNYMVEDDTVVSQVRGYLQNSRILDTAYMSDGTIEVTVGVSLRGPLADMILPKTLPFKGLVAPQQAPAPAPAAPAPAPATGMPEAVAPDAPLPDRPAVPYTAAPGPMPIFSGLVVDARGLGLRPALSPRIVDEKGGVVYGSAKVGRDFAVRQGMAGYAKDPAAAEANARVAGKPMSVKALGVAGRAGTDVMVSDATAAAISKALEKNDFLAECRVMFVVD